MGMRILKSFFTVYQERTAEQRLPWQAVRAGLISLHYGTNLAFQDSLLQLNFDIRNLVPAPLSWTGRRPVSVILHIRNNPNFFSDYIVAATAKNWRFRWEVLCYEVSL
jgi:hypothetical protein